MAKLKAPLMSLGASGQLGKALVFFGWKGLDVVREYVIPSNPMTSGQLTQRGYLTAAVAAVHTAQGLTAKPLIAVDVAAYSTWALIVKAATTWFNQVCKNWLDVKVDGKTPCIYSSGEMTDTDKDDFRMRLDLNEETPSDLAAGKFYLGTSKTALVQSEAATVNAGDFVNLTGGNGFSGLTAGVKYYWQFRPDAADPCEGANSGIYYATAT